MKFNSFSKSHSKQFVDLWFVFVRKQHMSEKCITFLAMFRYKNVKFRHNTVGLTLFLLTSAHNYALIHYSQEN